MTPDRELLDSIPNLSPPRALSRIIAREKEAFTAKLRDRWMPTMTPPGWSPSRGDPIANTTESGQEGLSIKGVQEKLGVVRSDYASLQSQYDSLLQEYSRMMVQGHRHTAADKLAM